MNNSSIKIHPIPFDEKPLEQSVGQLSVDIFHEENRIIILAPIAGVKENDIKISINEDVMMIQGTRPHPHPEIGSENYYTKECFWGEFSRAILLPPEAQIAKISAKFENNLLEIEIPKTPKPHSAVIKINSK